MAERKEFRAESKKLLEMMINSIYTHKEIFLRELISNASDALDKIYIKSLNGDNPLNRDELEIKITPKKDERILLITDNGIGMTKDELETNLGVIAKSGSYDYKKENADNKTVGENSDIIGQFGVGFYSAFMVAKKVEVISKTSDSDVAYKWTSEGADGYEISEESVDFERGTQITLYLKEAEKEENDENPSDDYGDYLLDWKLRSLIKKYSDYIRYPIKAYLTKHVHEDDPENPEQPKHKEVLDWETVNSQIPIWKRSKTEVKEEEYSDFYKEKFSDWNNPLFRFHTHAEGSSVSYDALLYIPEKTPYNFYSKEYEKGLAFYSSGVMLTEKSKELLPDYFSFVRGIVDSPDVSLNISREFLQQDKQLKLIARGVGRFIKNELKKALMNEREKYENFWGSFGTNIKFGVYDGFGVNKGVLKDLLIFKTSYTEGDEKPKVEGEYTPLYSTLDEYITRMKEEQKEIYYASGSSISKIKSLPRVEAALEKGLEVIFLTDNVDEFALQALVDYDGKSFKSVQSADFDSSTEDEKKELEEKNSSAKDIFEVMRNALSGKVTEVRFSNALKKHAVSISSSGAISTGMEKVLGEMPSTEQKPKAEKVLEINPEHAIANKLRYLADNDKELLTTYSEILYGQALLIEGLTPENPAEFAEKVIGNLAN